MFVPVESRYLGRVAHVYQDFFSREECKSFVKLIDGLPLELTPPKKKGEADRFNRTSVQHAIRFCYDIRFDLLKIVSLSLLWTLRSLSTRCWSCISLRSRTQFQSGDLPRIIPRIHSTPTFECTSTPPASISVVTTTTRCGIRRLVPSQSGRC